MKTAGRILVHFQTVMCLTWFLGSVSRIKASTFDFDSFTLTHFLNFASILVVMSTCLWSSGHCLIAVVLTADKFYLDFVC